MNAANLSPTPIDPTGKYTLTTRCRTGRSIRGTRLPPTNSFVERRQIEADCVEGLLAMEGELAGKYLPLHGNKSGVLALLGADPEGKYANGMSNEEEEDLRSRGNLFQEPDSTLLLSSGCGRHWPDARGIFHNEAKNFFTWVNEEDQMRIISMQPGADVSAIFVRFANATAKVKECLAKNGKDFMFNDHLGFILTCPSNLGTNFKLCFESRKFKISIT
jgi:creatine kinase